MSHCLKGCRELRPYSDELQQRLHKAEWRSDDVITKKICHRSNACVNTALISPRPDRWRSRQFKRSSSHNTPPPFADLNQGDGINNDTQTGVVLCPFPFAIGCVSHPLRQVDGSLAIHARQFSTVTNTAYSSNPRAIIQRTRSQAVSRQFLHRTRLRRECACSVEERNIYLRHTIHK
ncbi:hypothetical protein LSAT2_032610 [Lamellibrachia satsuma]|nr:hypothetical protein LSAT2_032610 [Lamellibrachia satsuma]